MPKLISFSSSQIPPPSNWQQFENLCWDLWSEIWGDSNAQKNGRSGQNQYGVDISGNDQLSNGVVCGVQCKGKDNYLDKMLSIAELEQEVSKAKKYKPSLKFFIIATSGPKDQKVEARAREITEEHKVDGLFSVVVFGWADIVDRMERHKDLIERHYPWLFNKTILPEESIYDFWKSEVTVDKMSHCCNYMPSANFDLYLPTVFINCLHSYLQKIDAVIESHYKEKCLNKFSGAIENFNKVAADVIGTCYQHGARGQPGEELIYWVNDSHLACHHKGEYIEYRKGVLRSLFFQLIVAANFVISVRNKTSALRPDPYVEFCNSFPSLFGSALPSPRYYPMYPDEDVKQGRLYSGLIAVDSFVRVQIYPSNSLL